VTDSKGQYFFRTIKPVEYTLQGAFRCPHIHFAISKSGHRLIATQLLIKGHPANERDGLFKNLRARGGPLESIVADFQPVAGSKLKEYAANWDIVVGRTAQELEDGTLGIGLGKPDRPPFRPGNARQ
jgi:protocatechuate 3,4-dioxygenase beta subunit